MSCNNYYVQHFYALPCTLIFSFFPFFFFFFFFTNNLVAISFRLRDVASRSRIYINRVLENQRILNIFYSWKSDFFFFFFCQVYLLNNVKNTMTYNLPIRGDKLTCLVKFQGFGRDTYKLSEKNSLDIPRFITFASTWPWISTNRTSAAISNSSKNFCWIFWLYKRSNSTSLPFSFFF